MRQWFFTIDVLARCHCCLANGRVPVIWRGDHHGIKRLFLLEKDSIVAVRFCRCQTLAMPLLRARDLSGIDVAKGDDIVTQLQQVADVALDLSTHADRCDIQFVTGLEPLSANDTAGKNE
jgi:hypothetical protein